jgi:hypothetical protein
LLVVGCLLLERSKTKTKGLNTPVVEIKDSVGGSKMEVGRVLAK